MSKIKRNPRTLIKKINSIAYCDIGGDDTTALYREIDLEKLVMRKKTSDLNL